jgi:Arc/MetJ-type ribon-helix-helix transcriptional regulator
MGEQYGKNRNDERVVADARTGRPGPDTTPNRAGADSVGMTDYTTVSIPKDLADRVEETIEGTSFSSTSDLVRFLLRSIVIQHEQQGELTEAEFSEIADQLEDLGYLD